MQLDWTDGGGNLTVTDLDVRPVHGNEGRSWTVVFPAERESWQDVQLWHRRLFSVLLTILTETSVMAFTRFERILRERFEENVSEKIVVVKPYCSLYDDLFPEEQYLTAERIEVLRPQPYRPFQPQSAPAMAWSERLSATYSLEEAHISLQRRYDALLPAFNSKHRVLLNNSEIKQVITELREEGWKDWHLLTAIIGMTANAYVNSNMPHSTSSRALEGAWKGAVEAMKQNHLGPAPWDGVYTREALQRTLDASMHSTLLGLGYEPRQRVPDLPAVRRFLRVRHNYWTDDIEHPDPFES